MKALILGYGSIGQRHAANLRALYPDCEQMIYDPFHSGYNHHSFQELLFQPKYDFAIIASPVECHLSQMIELSRHDIPFLCEKPPCDEIETSKYRVLVDYITQTGLICAIAFQYRFHKQARTLDRHDNLSFIAQDDLLARYGPTVGGTMASHALDLVLWACGPAAQWDIESDGVQFKGKINHRNGSESLFDLRMDIGPRVLQVNGTRERINLEPDDSAYAKMLSAFVSWATGSERDSRLASLRDGLQVMEILEGAKR
jgi:predicted dehydrogenase